MRRAYYNVMNKHIKSVPEQLWAPEKREGVEYVYGNILYIYSV